MKLLHLRAGNLYGGVETTMVEQARHQELYPEIELHFALCFAGRLKEQLEHTSVPLDLLGRVRIRNPTTVWRARHRLRELLGRKRPDVVITHSSWEHVIFAPVVRAAGLPMVFWLHDATSGSHWLERRARSLPPDFALCNSYFTLSHLSNLYPHVGSEVIYCPLVANRPSFSDEELERLRSELNTPKDGVVITQFGRMEEWKGHDFHFRALSLLRDLPNWVCWQVGGAQRPHEQRYLDELKRTAAQLGLADRVFFLGQRSDIPKLLAATDIHCQPNVAAEPFGNVFIEALFAGVPSITTAIGGPKEILDESCGVLVPEGDLHALGAALRDLVQNPALRRKLGAAGPNRARALCDVKAQMERLSDVLTAGVLRKLAA
jgi:glycosyltransferase involved in cell wall biosynthesis